MTALFTPHESPASSPSEKFRRWLAWVDAQPQGERPTDNTPLTECEGGPPPTVGDLRAVVVHLPHALKGG